MATIQQTLAALDMASMTLTAPDARRMMTETAMHLRARLQRHERGDAVHLADELREAQRILDMWEGY